MTKTAAALQSALQAAENNTLQFTAAIRATGVTVRTLNKTVESNPTLFVGFDKPGMIFGSYHIRLA
jgi:hypothetical protein